MGNRNEDSWFMYGIRRRNFRQDQTRAPEVPRHQKAAKKKKHVRKGCPGNNGKQHVFVTWTEPVEQDKPVLEHYDFTSYEFFHRTLTVCAGCDKVKSKRYNIISAVVRN